MEATVQKSPIRGKVKQSQNCYSDEPIAKQNPERQTQKPASICFALIADHEIEILTRYSRISRPAYTLNGKKCGKNCPKLKTIICFYNEILEQYCLNKFETSYFDHKTLWPVCKI